MKNDESSQTCLCILLHWCHNWILLIDFTCSNHKVKMIKCYITSVIIIYKLSCIKFSRYMLNSNRFDAFTCIIYFRNSRYPILRGCTPIRKAKNGNISFNNGPTEMYEYSMESCWSVESNYCKIFSLKLSPEAVHAQF